MGPICPAKSVLLRPKFPASPVSWEWVMEKHLGIQTFSWTNSGLPLCNPSELMKLLGTASTEATAHSLTLFSGIGNDYLWPVQRILPTKWWWRGRGGGPSSNYWSTRPNQLFSGEACPGLFVVPAGNCLHTETSIHCVCLLLHRLVC